MGKSEMRENTGASFLMMRIASYGAAMLTMLLAIQTRAGAQGISATHGNDSLPMVGGVGGLRAPPLISSVDRPGAKRHLDPAGKPCLTVGGFVQAQKNHPKIFDHVIVANNKCVQRIRINACYFSTQNCISMEIPGRQRRQAILGIFPALKDFRYEYREQF